MRITPGVTVRDYLKSREEMGVIKYNPFDKVYIVFNGRLEMILEGVYNKTS